MTIKVVWAVILAWLFNIIIAVDCVLNAIIGGDGGETISSRLGKGKLAKKPVHTFLSRVVDLFFEIVFDMQDHCVKSIQSDEGKNAVSEVVTRVKLGKRTLYNP